jgi:hypothetical protein
MTFCERCGAVLPAGARFCPQCASPVSGAGTSPLSTSLASGSDVRSPPLPGAPTQRPGSPGQSTIPLLPGESVRESFQSDPKGMRSVMLRRSSIMFGIMAAIFTPFILLSIFGPGSASGRLIGIGLFASFLIVFGGLLFGIGLRGREAARILLTDRRILVENLGRVQSSESISLENVGDVEINTKGGALKAGVAWVYILPMGTKSAIVGGGRARHVAAGVVYIPALPIPQADRLKNLVLSRARVLQSGSA